MALRAVLIGCGAMSRAWLEAATRMDGLEVVGLADIDVGRARARTAEFALGDAHVASDAPSLLRATQPDILFDVTVPAARHGVVSAALSAGCHVLTEKPMAESMADARDLVARAKAAGRMYAVVQNRRYLASVRRIARVVRSGIIGAVTDVHADFFRAPHFGGFREEMEHVLLLDMAIHGFDAMRCMTGLDAVGVTCREWEPKQSWYHQGSSAAAWFDLSNGGVFTYRGSWCAQGLPTSWECAWRIVGENGTLLWDGDENIRIERVTGPRDGLFDAVAASEAPALDAADRVGGHVGVIADFLAAIRSQRPPETRGEDNIKSLAMALGAIASAQTGERRHLEIEAS